MDIASTIITFVALLVACSQLCQEARNNAYERKVKYVQAINKLLCRLIKKNLYLDEMCEHCLTAGAWHELSARITCFMNTPAYEHLLQDLNDLLCEEMLNVLVFSRRTRREIEQLITHINELDGLIVIVTDPLTFKPQEIRKQICHIKESWLRLQKLFAKDLRLTSKETKALCEATIRYVNIAE